MLRTWLNSDSPVCAKTYKKMNSLRWKAWAWAQSLVLIVILARCLSPVQCFGANLDSEFTYLLPPGRAECFFQPAIKNGTMEVEYQVIAGAGMDVDFSIISPHGISLFFEARRSDGVHVVEPTEEGDYQICFDNTFSRFSEKLVFFEIIIEGQGGDVGDDEWPGLDEPEGSLLEYKLDDIRESMDGLHRRLERSRQMQVVLRAFEARDRNLLEDNLWRVSFWSCTSVVVLLCVALTQVYTVRKLFDDKRRVYT